MAMKQRSGTKSKTIRGMLDVFQSTFSRSGMKQCLEFTLAKLRRLCKYLADAYNSNSHVCGLHCLTFVCENKQENQCNEASRLSENVLKRAQCYLT